MKKYILISVLIAVYMNLNAEGTKQLRPASSDYGYLQINDVGRPFALTTNTDSLHRLYIHIENTSEKIYFGFKPHSTNSTLGQGKFRIKNPTGTIVYALTNVPTSGTGYISTYTACVAGPKIGGTPSSGYTPFSLTPTVSGDFYIEFSTTLSAKYVFDMFDITVVNSSNQPINGRVWSYAWDLNTMGSTNPIKSTFYVYTSDKYVSKVNLNSLQPYGFVISCNSTGCGKTGNGANDRKSVNGNLTYPEHKIFLNVPDTNVYTIAEKPTMIEDLMVVGTPTVEQDIKFYLNMSKAGTIDIMLDLDGNPGFQANGEDVALVKQIISGGDTIVWDAKNGNGNFVESDVIVSVSSKFATGVTHLPIYDPEYNPNGYIVHRVLPDTTRAGLYWDDSGFSSGTLELLGNAVTGQGHNFPTASGGFGNNRTMNTWWNGFENNDLASFSFPMNQDHLPIELSNWDAENKGSYVQLDWTTASEKNNHFFEIERSEDGDTWYSISTIMGAGDSKTAIEYTDLDQMPFPYISYYKLKQTDYNGEYTYSDIETINRGETEDGYIQAVYNKNNQTITIQCNNIEMSDINIYNTTATCLNNMVTFLELTPNTFQISIERLHEGIYIIQTPDNSTTFYKK